MRYRRGPPNEVPKEIGELATEARIVAELEPSRVSSSNAGISTSGA
jgi:hypothetical protein